MDPSVTVFIIKPDGSRFRAYRPDNSTQADPQGLFQRLGFLQLPGNFPDHLGVIHSLIHRDTSLGETKAQIFFTFVSVMVIFPL